MTDWISLTGVATHTVSAAIGYLVCRIGTVRAARRWPDPPHLEDVMHGDHGHHDGGDDPVSREVRRGTHIATLAVVASVLLLIIGGQAYLYQRDQSADDQRVSDAVAELKRTTDCVRSWGEDFAETTSTRVGETDAPGAVDLERAQERRDDALDEIILTVIAFREIPPSADDADFDRALREYAAAIRNRDRVQSEVETTRDLNEYPRLECDDKSEEQ